jgi:hypothetical protein
VYANGFTCWYNRTDFTLDFLVYLPAEPAAAPHGPVMRQPVLLTARVKFAPALIFRLMRTLEEAMSNYEHQFGHTRRALSTAPAATSCDWAVP